MPDCPMGKNFYVCVHVCARVCLPACLHVCVGLKLLHCVVKVRLSASVFRHLHSEFLHTKHLWDVY